MQKITDKIALITGGGRGIGAAIATNLAHAGAQVIVCGRTQKPIAETAARITQAGGKAMAITADVTDLESVETLAHRVKKDFGRVDILVNNAGVGSFSTPLHQLDPDEWERVINTNLRGVYYCIRAFVP